MAHYFLTIDQGTTGTTAALVDAHTFQFASKVNKEFPQIYPKPSWVEHNLNDIWDTVKLTIKEVIKKENASVNDVVGIGITNQRETTCAFNSNGEPLANAIVWQDRRTSNFCLELKDKGMEKEVKEKTGLTLDPYFSATKMNWLLNNHDTVKNCDDLKFGTIDTFLLYKLTGNKIHATDTTNASRTLLMNLNNCEWDQGLCEIFGVSKDYLPEIKDSIGTFGETQGLSFLPDGIPITGILGDQQAALFGQVGFNPGDMKCTYGTGAFMLLNTGTNIQYSNTGLLTTVGYSHKGKHFYALEGSCYIAGAAVQWLRDNLKFFNESPEIEAMAKKVKSLEEMEHILFLPFFTGIGSPYWAADFKAAIVGLTRDSAQPHMAKACLDGIALSISDLVDAMRKDFGKEITSLKVDGGACQNNLLMETQATVCELDIIRPQVIETTAYGAALAAAIGAGEMTFEKVKDHWSVDQTFKPTKNEAKFYQMKKRQWSETIQKLI